MDINLDTLLGNAYQHHLYFHDFSSSIFAYRNYVSSSYYSHSTEYSSLLNIGYHQEVTNFPCPYISADASESNHTQTRKELCTKLNSLIGSSDRITCKYDDSMGFAVPSLRLLFVKQDVCPDIFFNIDGKTFLLMEIHSSKKNSHVYDESDYRSTIRKLAIGLAEQLRHLRQANRDITTLSGFYFPTIRFMEKPMEKVKCTWNEELMQFIITPFVYRDTQEFELDFRSVALEQREIFDANGIRAQQPFQSVIPLTSSFLGMFGADAIQLCSGDSFVIQTTDNIYKFPFFVPERERLQFLQLSFQHNRNSIRSMSKCILPHDCHLFSDSIIFYVYPRCKYPPLSREVVRSFFSNTVYRHWWVQTVIEAIQEFHEYEMAHLDIRLPNICYHDNRAVLIDLDRSVAIKNRTFNNPEDKTIFVTNTLGKYSSSSEMYKVTFDCNDDKECLIKLDYKQLAILLMNILDPADNTNSNVTPPNLTESHQFCQELYRGVLNQEQLVDFLDRVFP